MPSQNHAAVQTNLGAEFLKHREFRPMSELTLELSPGFPKTPDLCIYPRQPIDFRRDVVRRTDPPLLTVEIVSPSQGMADMMEKVEHYHAHGVKSVWVIVPELRGVTIFPADGSQQSHHAGVVRDPVIGISADLDFVFS